MAKAAAYAPLAPALREQLEVFIANFPCRSRVCRLDHAVPDRLYVTLLDAICTSWRENLGKSWDDRPSHVHQCFVDWVRSHWSRGTREVGKHGGVLSTYANELFWAILNHETTPRNRS